jgi:hypothetical protein
LKIFSREWGILMDFNKIPEELKQLKQWVLWRSIMKIGEKKPSKIPYQISGIEAKTNNPDTWNSFESVINKYSNNGKNFSGIGFVFTDNDPYIGIDFDNCVDEDRNIQEDVKFWISKFSSYTEYSQSGKGIHIICKGVNPGHRKQKGIVEIYENVRYFAWTGKIIENYIKIKSCQETINEFYYTVFKEEEEEENEIQNEYKKTYLPSDDKEEFYLKVLQVIKENGHGLFSKYGEFLRFCMGCKAVGIPYEEIDPILQMSDGYNPVQNKKLYEKLQPKKVDFGTVYYFATKANNYKLKELLCQKKEFAIANFCKNVSKNTPIINNQCPVNNKPLPERDITNDIKLFSYSDILNTAGNMEDNAIVQHLLYREGISMLFGEPGCGKTWLMLDAVVNITEGKKVWGRYNCDNPSKVLLLEGDFSFLLLKDRLKNFPMTETGKNNFRSLTTEEFEKKGYEYCLDSEEGKRNIELFIKQFRPDILVIDSLCSFMEGDESKSDSVKPILSYLRTLSQKYKIHIMVIHHSRKRTSMERQGRKLDQSDMIGSSLFQRKVDSLFAVNTLYEDDEKIDNKGLVIDVKGWLKYKVKYEYAIVDNEFGRAEVKYNYENFESAKPKKQKAKEAIFNILFYDPDDAKTKNQLINLTQINVKTIEIALKQLINDDKIEAIGTTTDRKYKIKLKNNFIDNLKCENDNSPMCINSWESTNKTYIYQHKDSPNADRRVIGELSDKNSNSPITLLCGCESVSTDTTREIPHSPIDISCIGELEDNRRDEDDFNREEVPF